MGSLQGKTWRLEQLGGDRSVFELSGYSAPFGRARQGAVVKTGLKVRTERIFYPGSNSPTRHIFGTRENDWELHGRWRDRALGRGGAQAKLKAAKVFVADSQPIQITWGDVIVYTGFIDELEAGIEAENEVEWTFRISIDSDETTSGSLTITSPIPGDLSATLGAMLDGITVAVAIPKLPGSLFDIVDSAVDTFRSVTSSLRATVNQFSSFKDATLAQINRAVAGVEDLRNAAVDLRETFISIPSDARGVGQRASDIVRLQVAQASVEDQIRQSLAAGAEIERGATVALVGRIRTTFIAADGDTWESISTRFYGTPDRAADLRDANGAAPGQAPTPGTTYLVPR